MDTLTRRIGGTAAAILLAAVATLGYELASAPPAGSYEVVARLGRAGSGLNVGTDVKVRGVAIGAVTGIRYEDATAFATLRLERSPRLPAPEDLSLAVTAKTLIGEKQVQLSFPDGRLGSPPYLQAGDVITASGRPTELQAAVAELAGFLEAVDGRQVAAIVEALAEQQGTGEQIGENLELGQRLAAFGDRTAAANLANLRRLADVAEALASRAGDFNRLNDALPRATGLLPDRRAAVAESLTVVSEFASMLGRFLEVEEARISRLLTIGDPVGAVLEARAPQITNLVHGLLTYTRGLGRGGGFLSDGSEYAYFRILLTDEGFSPESLLCQVEPLADPVFACPERSSDQGRPGLADDSGRTPDEAGP